MCKNIERYFSPSSFYGLVPLERNPQDISSIPLGHRSEFGISQAHIGCQSYTQRPSLHYGTHLDKLYTPSLCQRLH